MQEETRVAANGLVGYTLLTVVLWCCAQVLVGVESLGPLQRLHRHLGASLDLATRLQGQLGGRVAAEAIHLEMRVGGQAQLKPQSCISI